MTIPALLRDVVARTVAIGEALDDGALDLARTLTGDLECDVAAAVARLVDHDVMIVPPRIGLDDLNAVAERRAA